MPALRPSLCRNVSVSVFCSQLHSYFFWLVSANYSNFIYFLRLVHVIAGFFLEKIQFAQYFDKLVCLITI